MQTKQIENELASGQSLSNGGLCDRPKYGTAPIRCGKMKCKWRGYETELRQVHTTRWTKNVCPLCNCESYMFMTPGEIKAWERSKAHNAQRTIDTLTSA